MKVQTTSNNSAEQTKQKQQAASNKLRQNMKYFTPGIRVKE